MNAAPTVSLTTIPSSEGASAPEAPSETSAAPAAPPAGTPEASVGASAVETSSHEDEIAKRLEGISRREAKARREETARHEREAAFAAKEKQIEEKLAKLDAALSDPVQYLLDEGKDPVEVARRFSKPESEEEKRIRKLEERLKAQDEREETAKEEAKWRREEAANHQILRQFVSEINEDNSPNLVALYQPQEIKGLVSELLNRRLDSGETVLQSFNHVHGRNPTNAEVRESLEAEALIRATKILEGQKRREAPPAGAPQAPVPAQSGPKGISNKHASASAPSATRKPSYAERRAKAMRDLTERLEAEAATRE